MGSSEKVHGDKTLLDSWLEVRGGDEWYFRVGLSDGRVFGFTGVDIFDDDWLYLLNARVMLLEEEGEHDSAWSEGEVAPFTWGRPVLVRRSAIVWIADCDS